MTAPPDGVSHRANLKGFLRWFETRKSLPEVIDAAILRNHPHQNCLSWADRRKVADHLRARATTLNAQTSFEDIYATVTSCVRPPFKRADLLIYDLSLRIGAYKRKYPSSVYLHRGARDGAKLVLNTKRLPGCIAPSVLPGEFASLCAHEIEDCLCIYKPQIESLRQAGLL